MRCQAGSRTMVTAAEQLASAGNVEQLPKALRNILTKARTSWLRNQEVVDLLTNYKAYDFRVSKEPPQKPPGTALIHLKPEVIVWLAPMIAGCPASQACLHVGGLTVIS